VGAGWEVYDLDADTVELTDLTAKHIPATFP
jgi:hypothetical protein